MQIPVKIDKDIYDKLKKIKEKDGVPMAVSLKKAVELYFKNRGV